MISTINVPLYKVIVSKYSLASIFIVSPLAIFGIAGILLVLPSGKSIVPNGISLIASPIVAVSVITTSAKVAESKVCVCSSAIASILINGAIFLMTTAFQRAQKYYSSVFCLVYFQILYSILIGYFIFDEYLNFYAVIGAILIILSGIFSIPSQQKQKNA